MHKALGSTLSTREKEKNVSTMKFNSVGRFPKGKSLKLLRGEKKNYLLSLESGMFYADVCSSS